MAEPRGIRCPICRKTFDPSASQAMPFCSPRCQQIDLGRWLREAYSVPVVRDPEDEDEASDGSAHAPDES
jgi:endogenous inhibitor of DNA gyrase (YacG/DUF329 family)